jgi:hypothetical protein
MGTTTSPAPPMEDFFANEVAKKQKAMEESNRQLEIANRSTAESVGRGTRAFGTGMNDAIGSAIGAIPDLAASGMNAVLNLGRRAGGYSPDAQTFGKPGQYTKWTQDALNSVGDTLSGGHLNPDTPTERNLYSVGHGVGDTVATLGPAGTVARLSRGARGALGEVGGARQALVEGGDMATSVQPGSMTNSVASNLSANPFMQTTAGAVGGSVEQATGSKWGGLAGAAAVPLGAGVFRGLVSPGLSQLNPEQARLRDLLLAEGVPISPGAQSGSKPMKTVESVLENLPFTGGPAAADAEARRVAFNKAALKKAGETEADYATPGIAGDVENKGVVQKALDRSGGKMQDIYARNDLNLDPATMQPIAESLATAKRTMSDEAFGVVKGKYDDFVDKILNQPSGGTYVPGPAYKQLDSDLSRMIRTGTDPAVKETLLEMRNALRDGFGRNIANQEEGAALAEARRQYASGKVIEGAMDKGTPYTLAGNIPPSGLIEQLKKGTGNFVAKGAGDLRDLAAAGKTFLTETIPNSGTAQRAFWQSLLTGGAIGGGFAHDPMTALITGGTSLALPTIAQTIMRSDAGKRWLTNQAAASMPGQPTAGMWGATQVDRLPGLMDPIPAPRKQRYEYDVTPTR